jgi:predicted secreted hydrolase
MAHSALANLKEKSFRPFQRFNRSGPRLAGSSTEHFETWNEDWSGKPLPDGSFHLQASDHATGSAFAIDLTLQPGKPLVFHGEKGYSRKGSRTQAMPRITPRSHACQAKANLPGKVARNRLRDKAGWTTSSVHV